MAFDLSSIRRGPDARPPRVVVYGKHKVGKTTFAAGAPSPIFIQCEDGEAALDIARFPLCKSLGNVHEAIGTLLEEQHEFETVVLDSADWLENLIWAHVAKSHDVESIESFDYGKGYQFAADEMRTILDGLNALRLERNMVVIVIAHHQVKRFDDPTSGSYDRYQIKLHKKAAAELQEWADVIAYAAIDVNVKTEDVGFNKTVKRGLSTGRRVIKLTDAPAYDAGNRYGLPDELPLQWSAFQSALAEALNGGK